MPASRSEPLFSLEVTGLGGVPRATALGALVRGSAELRARSSPRCFCQRDQAAPPKPTRAAAASSSSKGRRRVPLAAPDDAPFSQTAFDVVPPAEAACASPERTA